MIKVELKKSGIWESSTTGMIFLMPEDFSIDGDVKKVEDDFYPHLKKILSSHKFSGKQDEMIVLSGNKEDELIHFVFVGVGKSEELENEIEPVRKAIGHAIKKFKHFGEKSFALSLPSFLTEKIDHCYLVEQITVASHLAAYEFDKFKSKSKENKPWTATMSLCIPDARYEIEKQVARGNIIGDATNETRHLADLPPNIATPTFMSEHIKKMAKDLGLEFNSFGREKAEELGMGGFLSVDSGSDEPGKFVTVEYRSQKKDAKTIAFVGKGVTFDSGGISLKPSQHMSGMKFDMSGASAVVGTMKAIAQLKPEFNVVGVMPFVENMPSGKSNKQDDIITFMNGKTAEIKNTDAEGRLILADALCYAEKFFKPDVMVDFATLTGVCMYALGHFYAGMVTKDDDLRETLFKKGRKTGDRVWALPFDDVYKKAIKSDVADISNTGAPNYLAGAITAGFFLSNFVEKASWAHIDIAGTADGVPDVSYFGSGATGAGVRLMVEMVDTKLPSL